MTTGELIRKARKDKGLTQKQLGELCIPPIAEPTIRRYELGKLNPKLSTLEKIARALLIDTSDLIPPTVGGYILKAMHRKGISVESLSELTSIDYNKLIDVLASKHISISKSEQDAINKALGIDLCTFAVLGLEQFEDANDGPMQPNLLNAFRQLNEKGQKVAVERVEELTKIPDYQKAEDGEESE